MHISLPFTVAIDSILFKINIKTRRETITKVDPIANDDRLFELLCVINARIHVVSPNAPIFWKKSLAY